MSGMIRPLPREKEEVIISVSYIINKRYKAVNDSELTEIARRHLYPFVANIKLDCFFDMYMHITKEKVWMMGNGILLRELSLENPEIKKSSRGKDQYKIVRFFESNDEWISYNKYKMLKDTCLGQLNGYSWWGDVHANGRSYTIDFESFGVDQKIEEFAKNYQCVWKPTPETENAPLEMKTLKSRVKSSKTMDFTFWDKDKFLLDV